MKICVLSNKGKRLNEGQRNLAARLVEEMEHSHEVLHLNAKQALCTVGGWKEMISFRPEVVHFFLRPSLSTFAAAKAVQFALGCDGVFFSAVQPPLGSLQAKLLHFLAPTAVFCLSGETELEFRSLGLKTRKMLFGVNSEKFAPVSPTEKSRLKVKFGLDPAIPVALHVGHLTCGRNIDALVFDGCDRSFKLVVVASPMFAADNDLLEVLNTHGALVVHEHLEKIEEVYQMADIYLFPTLSRSNCIEAPLSVFEAMATNLPVVATRFGVLASGFDQVDGLYLVEAPEDIPSKAREVLKYDKAPETRDKITPYSWKNASDQLTVAYKDILYEN